ncbi:cytochrome c [Burkholderiaceae bacterium DAT-1]|nr:cytochrome c [Burkholderiaceae bacterium DAT-1]
MNKLTTLFTSSLLGAALVANAATLEIRGTKGVEQLKGARLVAGERVASIVIPDDVAYHQPMRYQAIPVAHLLRQAGIQPDDEVQFIAADGFAATLSAAPLLAQDEKGARAWLAIEGKQHWPKLPNQTESAGPFYLVWTQPEAGKIVPEQWPYQIVKISVQAPLVKRWPMIVPKDAGERVQHGFKMFTTHCFACHTLNLAGDARLGPDLNVPMNPVEYFRDDILAKYIRNPQSIRTWPTAKMPTFDRAILNDGELADLIAYLGHMANHKVTSPIVRPPAGQ